MKALNNHIKWDHHQKQLLYEEEEVKVVPHSKIAKDSAGNLSCGSSNSGTYSGSPTSLPVRVRTVGKDICKCEEPCPVCLSAEQSAKCQNGLKKELSIFLKCVKRTKIE